MDPFPSIDIWQYLSLIILLFFSAFFSGTESAFFSLDKGTLNLLENDDSSSSKRILSLVAKSKELLICILISNNFTNILIATQTTIISQRLISFYQINEWVGFLINVSIVTFFILMFGEIIPKIFATKDPLWFAKKASFPISIIMFFLKPFSIIIQVFTEKTTHLLNVKIKPNALSGEEIKTLLDISQETGTIESEEKVMLSSIIDFSETNVKEIMVPRTDMTAVEKDDSLDTLIQISKETQYSRIPVYDDIIDNIIGIIYVKDILKYLPFVTKSPKIKDLLHPVFFVPEQKKIRDLLKEFQSQKVHMAIVVDEYGGVSGLVTLEDIIEEIVGEIQDEYDAENPLIERINDYEFLVDGKVSIEELNKELPEALPENDDIETISGFILHLIGKLPEKNEEVSFNHYKFVIENIIHKRIVSIRIAILHDSIQSHD